MGDAKIGTVYCEKDEDDWDAAEVCHQHLNNFMLLDLEQYLFISRRQNWGWHESWGCSSWRREDSRETLLCPFST